MTNPNETVLAEKAIHSSRNIKLSLVEIKAGDSLILLGDDESKSYVMRAEYTIPNETIDMNWLEKWKEEANTALDTIRTHLKPRGFVSSKISREYSPSGFTPALGDEENIQIHEKNIVLSNKPREELIDAFNEALKIPDALLINSEKKRDADFVQEARGILKAAGVPADKMEDTTKKLAALARTHFQASDQKVGVTF